MPENEITFSDNLQSHPFVTLIVPVAGNSSSLAANIKTLINQNYRPFDILFVLQDENDPAATAIEKITLENDQTSNVYSGLASLCSQKNYNLLTGIQTAGTKSDIFVFCDSGHGAPPDWLQSLIDPLVLNDSCKVSSGYHQIFPEKPWISSQGRAMCVLTLGLIRQLPLCRQPWGGATAIRREAYENLSVAEVWECNIVDDVSLAKVLQKSKVPVSICKKTVLKTLLDDVSFGGWTHWLTRQWAYLKFIFPGIWFVAGLLCFVVIASICASIVVCTTFFLLPFSLLTIQYSVIISLTFLMFATFLYLKHPAPGPFILWIPASLVALIMGGYCHLRTWFTTTIDWAGIRYKVGKNGKVLKIIRDKIL